MLTTSGPHIFIDSQTDSKDLRTTQCPQQAAPRWHRWCSYSASMVSDHKMTTEKRLRSFTDNVQQWERQPSNVLTKSQSGQVSAQAMFWKWQKIKITGTDSHLAQRSLSRDSKRKQKDDIFTRNIFQQLRTQYTWQTSDWPSITLPSESVLHALITSLDAEYNSKQLGLLRSPATSRTWIFSRGIIPLGSLS